MLHKSADASPAPRFLSHFRIFRAFALKKKRRFDFDELARALASGMSRREALRRFGIGLAAAFFADLTGLLPWAPAEPAAAAGPVAPTLTCSSANAAACVAGIVRQAAGAFQACAGSPGNPSSAPDLLPQLQGILAGEVDPGQLEPWLRATGMLFCFDIALNEAQTFQQSCVSTGVGCGAGTSCSNNLCCPAGLIGCGGLCYDTLNDPNNCGADPATACGHRCAAGESCVNGACTGGSGSGGGTGNTASGQGSSSQGQQTCTNCKGCCDPLGVCHEYDVQTVSFCGFGGLPCGECPPGKICGLDGGCCVPADPSSRICCPQDKVCFALSGSECCEQGCCQYGRGCVAISDQTHDHCGQNGAACMACGPNEDCVNGQCQSSNCHCSGARPSSAFTCCCCPGQMNGLWVNLQNGLDPNGRMTGPGFCGSCSTTCASEAICMSGVCRCPGGAMQVCTDKPCSTDYAHLHYCDGGACMGG